MRSAFQSCGSNSSATPLWTPMSAASAVLNVAAKVKHFAMPNLMANEEFFAEFIQDAATPENLASAALKTLRDDQRRTRLDSMMAEIAAGLGEPGASRRAAQAILSVLGA